jgi:hypothetical protein
VATHYGFICPCTVYGVVSSYTDEQHTLSVLYHCRYSVQTTRIVLFVHPHTTQYCLQLSTSVHVFLNTLHFCVLIFLIRFPFNMGPVSRTKCLAIAASVATLQIIKKDNSIDLSKSN